MKRLYKHKISGELVLVGDSVFIAKHPLVRRWYGVDSLLIRREIVNGNLTHIVNNFRFK